MKNLFKRVDLRRGRARSSDKSAKDQRERELEGAQIVLRSELGIKNYVLYPVSFSISLRQASRESR